jgi:site-specific recombinase XerD
VRGRGVPLGDRSRGLVFEGDERTLSDFLDGWLAGTVKGSVRSTTYESYERVIRCHIKPELGRRKLKTLAPDHVQVLYRRKLDAGLTPGTVRLVHSILSRALDQAVKWGTLPRNVYEATTPLRAQSEEIKLLDTEQVRCLLEEVEGSAWRPVRDRCHCRSSDRRTAWVPLAGRGSRKRHASCPTHQVNGQDRTEIHGAEEPQGPFHKAHQPCRGCALRSHKAAQNAERPKAGSLWEDHGLVFATHGGRPLDFRNVVRTSFKPLLKKAGLPDIRFHDLRHPCATLLLSRGFLTKLVQDLLGQCPRGP